MAISIILESAIRSLMNSARMPSRSSASVRTRRGRMCARVGTGTRRLGHANVSKSPNSQDTSTLVSAFGGKLTDLSMYRSVAMA